MKTFYSCRCFYTKNIFLKQFGIHIQYDNKKQFISQFEQVLRDKGCNTEEQLEDVIQKIQEEIDRRQSLGRASLARQRIISATYQPRHEDIYKLKEDYLAPEFLDLVAQCKSEGVTADAVMKRLQPQDGSRLYKFHVFQQSFCNLFLEEIEHFENSDCPKGRPNTMNKYGILLNELGFDEDFIIPLRKHYLSPITSILFPDWGGNDLDSHKAFIVTYKLGDDLDLSYHYDNAEITLNIALGKEFTGGTLYFGDMRTERRTDRYSRYDHQPMFGLLHRGQHLHGAMPIEDGERYNLIVWMRSSRVRNQRCPMCDDEPDLVEAVGFGDGFTREDSVVDVCTAS
ncbi:2-oxoglutarate and iron-dependent oxygenase domain-containing protein 2-like [Haliotis rubra]|uniref:2-oxoglutarate and iron-dependent oxygenase domain-containing protein 2-like n=1 Tax=Haliotis rubra TaxID=36100 RepID=UPI001EE56C2D|nr:2-oxoglutarate and iron-dependent oxygenase domain-containing protein 2-like [Haliotis rubra]